MKRLLTIIVGLLLAATLQTSAWAQGNGPVPVPSKAQLDWFAMERYAFIHFSTNTFTDQEWGDGGEDINLFNPTDLDCRQWARVCKQAGLKGIIVTAKHHSGFCLWPSKYTDYSVKNCPWKGANGGWGHYGGANENRNIDRSTYYGWSETVALIRKLQPNCIIWNEVGPDIRWCGNEAGAGSDTNWSRYNYAAHVPGQPDNRSLSQGEIDGKDFVPSEVNVSIRPGWFYHEFEDLKVKTVQKLWNIYLSSVGKNSTWLLNFPIDTRGRIHENDARNIIAFNKYLQKALKTDLAQQAETETTERTITLRFKKPVAFNLVQLRENIAQGQHIDRFTVEARQNGQWQKIAEGTTVGNKRIMKTGDIKADAIRVNTDARHIASISLFNAPAIKEKQEKEVYQLDRTKWTILQPDVHDARLMLDGNKGTMMHIDKGFPQDVVIDMGAEHQLKGFRYLPDQGDYFLRGIITHYEFAVSLDGTDWTTVSQGEFSNIAHNPLWQVVLFKQKARARYFRFRAIRNNKGWGDFGCAELDVLVK